MARRRNKEKFKGAEFVQKSTEKFKNKKKSTAKSDTSAGRPKKAAASATAKKYGSNKKSTKELLNKLSINKKPSTTSDKKEPAKPLSYSEKADIKAAISLKAKTKKPISGKSGGSKPSSSVSQPAIKVTDPENSSKTIHSPSSNMKGISSLASVSKRLQEQLAAENMPKTTRYDYISDQKFKHSGPPIGGKTSGQGTYNPNKPKKKTEEELKQEWLNKMKNPKYYTGL